MNSSCNSEICLLKHVPKKKKKENAKLKSQTQIIPIQIDIRFKSSILINFMWGQKFELLYWALSPIY